MAWIAPSHELAHTNMLARHLVTTESAGGWHLTTVEVDRIVGLLPLGLSACLQFWHTGIALS